MPRKTTIQTGDRFGLLTAIDRVRSAKGELLWRFACDCGNETVNNGQHPRRGTQISCGCDRWKSGERHHQYSHGKRHSRVYAIWNAMRSRCHNPNQPHYSRYGALGVQVCDKWRKSFEAFYEDMGDPPTETHSIDRIDPFGNYEPGNCRWATPSQQNLNKRIK
jgi:hypothetical protein